MNKIPTRSNYPSKVKYEIKDTSSGMSEAIGFIGDPAIGGRFKLTLNGNTAVVSEFAKSSIISSLYVTTLEESEAQEFIDNLQVDKPESESNSWLYDFCDDIKNRLPSEKEMMESGFTEREMYDLIYSYLEESVNELDDTGALDIDTPNDLDIEIILDTYSGDYNFLFFDIDPRIINRPSKHCYHQRVADDSASGRINLIVYGGKCKLYLNRRVVGSRTAGHHVSGSSRLTDDKDWAAVRGLHDGSRYQLTGGWLLQN